MNAQSGSPRMGFGSRLGVLVIDITRGSVDERWTRESRTRQLLEPIAQLLAAARSRAVPIFYTRGGGVSLMTRAAPVTSAERGSYLWKREFHDERGSTPEELAESMEIPAEIAPAQGEVVITKYKSSGFFGSPLQSFLTLHRVDTVVVCGTSTNSGVLHTAKDAASYNFRVIVPRECTATGTPGYYEVSLEMMDRTWADVKPLAEVLAHLAAMEPQEPAVPAVAAPSLVSNESPCMGMGRRLALLAVDLHRHQVDSAFPSSYDGARTAVGQIARLLEVARTKRLPVFYTTGGLRSLTARHYPATETERGSWLFKNELTDELGTSPEALELAFSIPEEIAPGPGETVVRKYKPSGFFDSPLKSFLNFHRIDTVIVCGSSTNSGVLSTVTDAFSHNFRVIVPEECCTSRDPQLHEVALQMMGRHLADVVSIEALLEELRQHPTQEEVV